MMFTKYIKWKFMLPLIVVAGAFLFPRYFAIQWSTSPVHLKEATAENIYVINLDRTPKRFAALKSQLEYLGLPYTRWSGTDGYVLELKNRQGNTFTGKDVKEGKAQWGLGVDHRFPTENGDVAYHVAYFDFFGDQETLLTPGCLGCALSHISVWQHMVKHNIPWALIMEDDTHLNFHFKSRFASHLKRLPRGWDMVYLSLTDNPDKQLLTIIGNNKFKKLGRDGRVMTGLHGYLLSLEGAKKLTDYVRSFHKVIDFHTGDAINEGVIDAYFNIVPLTDITEQSSTIDAMGRKPQ